MLKYARENKHGVAHVWKYNEQAVTNKQHYTRRNQLTIDIGSLRSVHISVQGTLLPKTTMQVVEGVEYNLDTLLHEGELADDSIPLVEDKFPQKTTEH